MSPASSPDLDYIRFMEGTLPPESSDDNQTDEEPSEDEEEDDDEEEEEWSNEEEDDATATMMTTTAAMKSQRSAARSVLAKTMSRGHPTTTTTRRRTKLSRLYISLFILSISSQTVSNMYSTKIFYIIAHRFVCRTVCPDEHTIHKKKTVWAVYNDRTQF